jgi:hypothetical protein
MERRIEVACKNGTKHNPCGALCDENVGLCPECVVEVFGTTNPTNTRWTLRAMARAWYPRNYFAVVWAREIGEISLWRADREIERLVLGAR